MALYHKSRFVMKICIFPLASSLYFFNILNVLTRRQTKDTFSNVKLYGKSIPHNFRMIRGRFVGQNHHLKKSFLNFHFLAFLNFPTLFESSGRSFFNFVGRSV